jgi:hypothetical protein
MNSPDLANCLLRFPLLPFSSVRPSLGSSGWSLWLNYRATKELGTKIINSSEGKPDQSSTDKSVWCHQPTWKGKYKSGTFCSSKQQNQIEKIDFRIITSNKFDLQLCRRNTCHAFLIIFFKASKDNKNLKETKRI